MPAARRAVAAAAIVGMLGAGCTGDDETVPSTTIANDPRSATTTTTVRETDGRLDLGIFLPRTGEGAQIGEPMIAVVEDTVDAINAAGGVLGTPIRLEIIDESADNGAAQLRELGIDAVIGPASTNVALTQLGALTQPTEGVVTCSPMATGLALDDFPDNGYFFRTAPSDSLQMAAIASRARDTGVTSAAVGYLDDPYGRGLRNALADELRALNIDLVAEIGFGGDEDDLRPVTNLLLADDPGVVVVLGDADDGSRLLAALDENDRSESVRRVLVNDAIRAARTTLQSLSDGFRDRVIGVAPSGTPARSDGPEGFFTAHAVDCVNLIALAATAAGTDDPADIRTRVVPIAREGRVCSSFDTCASFLSEGLEIDFNGLSGSLELANSSGDLQRARFDWFGFDDSGAETNTQTFEVS